VAVALRGSDADVRWGPRAAKSKRWTRRFRRLIDSLLRRMEHWKMREAPAKFYAKDNGLVFYDGRPVRAYHGWKEYQDGVQKEILETAESIKLTAGKELKVTRRRNDRVDDRANAFDRKIKGR